MQLGGRLTVRAHSLRLGEALPAPIWVAPGPPGAAERLVRAQGADASGYRLMQLLPQSRAHPSLLTHHN